MRISLLNRISFGNNQNINDSKNDTKFETHTMPIKSPDWFCPVEEDTVQITTKTEPRELTKFEKSALRAQKVYFEKQADIVSKEARKLQEDEDEIFVDMLDINVESKDILSRAYRLYDEAVELYLAASKKDFATEFNQTLDGEWAKREFTIQNGTVTMEEFDDDNDVIRKAYFGGNKVTIAKYNEELKGWDTCQYSAHSALLENYFVAMREFDKGGYSAKEQYAFDTDGEVVSYDKKYKQTPNGTIRSQERIIAKDGYIETLKNGYVKKANGAESAVEIFEFDKGQMKNYYKQFEKDQEGNVSADSMYQFDKEDGFSLCAIAFEQDVDNSASADTLFVCSKDGMDKVYLDYRYKDSTKTASAKKAFNFFMEKIDKCAFECAGNSSGLGKIEQMTFESMVEL